MVHSQLAEALLAELGELVEERRAETGTPGVAYGVVGDGASFASGSGVIGVDDPREITADTLFQLCSVTKPMTAALALGVVEEGLIGLDEPVAAYLPELALADPETRNGLTLRHLLVHTSGLTGDWPGDLAEYGAGANALARLIADYPQLTQCAPLGAYWGYCNPGYWLAGRLVEAVTGASFETAMRERLLAPLGMSETLFRSEDTTHRQLALPHKSGANGQDPIPDFSFPRARTASGGVLASMRDLLRFAAAALGTPLHDSKSAISETVRAAMMQPAVPAEGADVYQSMGWQVHLTTEAGPLVYHGGAYTGYITRLILAPTRGFAVALLTNSDAGYQLCRDAQALFAQRILDWQEPEPTYVEPAAQILDRYPGRYTHPDADHLLISRTEPGLRIDVAMRNGETVSGDCKALSDTEFTVVGGPMDGMTVTFLPGTADETAPTNLVRVGLRLGNRLPDEA